MRFWKRGQEFDVPTVINSDPVAVPENGKEVIAYAICKESCRTFSPIHDVPFLVAVTSDQKKAEKYIDYQETIVKDKGATEKCFYSVRLIKAYKLPDGRLCRSHPIEPLPELKE